MKHLFFLLLAALLFSGCGAKKYFQPDGDTVRLKYSGYTQSYLKDTKLDGATFEDGSVITADDTFYDSVIRGENTHFISQTDEKLIASDKNTLYLIDKKDRSLKSISTSQRIVSANISGNLVACVTADNSIMMYDAETGSLLFKSKQKLSNTVAGDFAKPLFFDDILVYPTLDGKIMIVDVAKKREIREFIISSEKYFNNVIYLERVGERIIAATKHNLLVISPRSSYEFKNDINAVKAVGESIYVACVDGRILELDTTLEVKNERKLPFSGLISLNLTDEHLYVVERSGYLIKTDRHLADFSYYELGDIVENHLFIGKTKLYYKTRFVTLP
jgi:WD40 repeat protein